MINKAEYNTNYYQQHKEKFKQYRKDNVEYLREYERKRARTPERIYIRLKSRVKVKKKNILLCSKQKFVDWYKKQERKCVYCNIPEELIFKLDWNKCDIFNYLEIDRKDNDKGYVSSNMVLACNICNTMKNNFLSYEEMKEIGKLLKSKWQSL